MKEISLPMSTPPTLVTTLPRSCAGTDQPLFELARTQGSPIRVQAEITTVSLQSLQCARAHRPIVPKACRSSPKVLRC